MIKYCANQVTKKKKPKPNENVNNYTVKMFKHVCECVPWLAAGLTHAKKEGSNTLENHPSSEVIPKKG